MTKATSTALALLCLMGLLMLAMTSYHEVRALNDMNVYRRISADISKNRETGVLQSEYPPLASSFFWIVERQPFIRAFALSWFVAIFLAVVFGCIYAARRLQPIDILSFPAALLGSAVLLGPELHFGDYDVFVALFLFFAWRTHQRKLFADSGGFLAVAGFLKLVPFIVAPVLYLLTPRNERRKFLRGFLVGTAVSVVIPLLVLGPSMTIANTRHMLAYHGGRGIQAETTWSGLDILYRAVIGEISTMDPRAGGYDNISISPHIVIVSLLVSVAGILFLIWWAWKKRGSSNVDQSLPFFLSFLWLFGFGSVLSPQYFVWILPLMFVWGLEGLWSKTSLVWSTAFLLTLAVLAMCTQWIFPLHYYEFLNQNNLFNTAVFTVRNVAMFVLMGLLLWRMTRVSSPQ